MGGLRSEHLADYPADRATSPRAWLSHRSSSPLAALPHPDWLVASDERRRERAVAHRARLASGLELRAWSYARPGPVDAAGQARRSCCAASSAWRSGRPISGSALRRTRSGSVTLGVADGVLFCPRKCLRATFRRRVLRCRRVDRLVHVLRHRRPVPREPRPLREARGLAGYRPLWADAREFEGAPPEHLRGAFWTHELWWPSLGCLVAPPLESAPESSRSILRTRCLTAGAAGWTGSGPLPQTTPSRSMHSKQIVATTLSVRTRRCPPPRGGEARSAASLNPRELHESSAAPEVELSKII